MACNLEMHGLSAMCHTEKAYQGRQKHTKPMEAVTNPYFRQPAPLMAHDLNKISRLHCTINARVQQQIITFTATLHANVQPHAPGTQSTDTARSSPGDLRHPPPCEDRHHERLVVNDEHTEERGKEYELICCSMLRFNPFTVLTQPPRHLCSGCDTLAHPVHSQSPASSCRWPRHLVFLYPVSKPQLGACAPVLQCTPQATMRLCLTCSWC